MSYITDKLRAPRREAEGVVTVPGQSLEEIVAANPERRKVLRGSLGLSLLSAFGSGGLLAACGGDDDPAPAPAPAPAPTPAPAPGPTPAQPLDYSINFKPLESKLTPNTVLVPDTYSMEVLFSAGDPVTAGAAGYKGAFQSSMETEQQAGGNHDGMHYFTLPGVDPQKGGLLVMNHEAMDNLILFPGGTYNAATATPEQKRIALSSVGVSVIEIELVAGKWQVKRNSLYNKRYTGNTIYRVSGPAASVVGATVVGTLNNCSSGHTPWGTYLTCEETTDNYLDPTQPDNGYGWVVEIDPQQELPGLPVKRTAMGRFDHENTAFMTDASNRVAFYMGDDGTPGCIYKFIPSVAFDATNRLNNASLLDNGKLYVARFNADGSGDWIELTQGINGLVAGATDPGNTTQGPQTPVSIDFNTQADVLINTKAAARVAGGTLMDRPEWITVGVDRTIYCTLTNNGGRQVVDAANPRVNNSHGHIVRWHEQGDSPLATTFKWELLLLAGDPSIAAANLKGNMKGATFSSPDGIRVDPKGRLWVQTDAGTGSSVTSIFGANSMHYVDQVTREVKRFLVGPVGCEITGIAYTPDLTTFFINIQHPTGTGQPNGNWPDPVLPSRSSTVVIRHKQGKPIGA